MALTAAQSKDLTGLMEAAIIVALNADQWLQTTGTVYEAGDATNQCASWTLTGGTAANSNDGWLYWTLTNSGTTRTVSVYKASTMQSADLVAQGSRTGDGAITLTAQNSSGLSGTVTVTYTGDDTDTANTLSFGLGGIAKILEKYVPLEEYTSWDAGRPLLAISVVPLSANRNNATFASYEQPVEVRIEYRDVYADIPTGWDAVQEVTDRLMRWFEDELYTAGKRFNAFLDSADGWIIDGPRFDIENLPLGEGDVVSAYALAGSVSCTISTHIVL